MSTANIPIQQATFLMAIQACKSLLPGDSIKSFRPWSSTMGTQHPCVRQAKSKYRGSHRGFSWIGPESGTVMDRIQSVPHGQGAWHM